MSGLFCVSKIVRGSDCDSLIGLLDQTADGHIEHTTKIGDDKWLVLLASRWRPEAEQMRGFGRAPDYG